VKNVHCEDRKGDGRKTGRSNIPTSFCNDCRLTHMAAIRVVLGYIFFSFPRVDCDTQLLIRCVRNRTKLG
jgi:hypothetical protein